MQFRGGKNYFENHIKHISTLYGQNVDFLGASAKLQKATISSVMSVCLYQSA
jgi:hypothetical protein